MQYRIVETDNYGGDYPDEKFVNVPSMSQAACEAIAYIIGKELGPDHDRYYKVEPANYKLQPGFTP